jgi:EAL domain-containing protein (putative c-di-GMP-specific phosphodiesterase class I)/CheY-like chemotaxis protein
VISVLVVDDEEAIRRSISRMLPSPTFRVVTSPHVHDAVMRLASDEFDVVLSDVTMPGMSGIDFLRMIRTHSLDLPVILMTGLPTVETATDAIKHGALRYFVKPFDPDELRAAVIKAAKLYELAKVRRDAADMVTEQAVVGGDRAGLEAQLDRSLGKLWMAYQPIVSSVTGAVRAYEALMRSDDQALGNPLAILDAAERLDQVQRVGRAVRERVADPLEKASSEVLLFVNLHPRDLEDPWLTDAATPLARVASRVILEITERASLGVVPDLTERVQQLRALGYRIAVDDLGAGYAGLSSFAQLEPEIVKLDMSLVRTVNESPVRQKVIRSITSMCADLGIKVVAEGVETLEERDSLVDLGCDLLQGYRFAKPGPPFPSATW